ncbi:hypothetical protein MYX82_10345 [Acidobacteria bacterium AH-259-D05]|nr:hypothetical protein [Acidobacteria bacterium AH-259-D05]
MKRKHKTCLFLFSFGLIALFTISYASPPFQGQLNGSQAGFVVVSEETGRATPNVTVGLYYEEGNVEDTFMTDRSGRTVANLRTEYETVHIGTSVRRGGYGASMDNGIFRVDQIAGRWIRLRFY